MAQQQTSTWKPPSYAVPAQEGGWKPPSYATPAGGESAAGPDESPDEGAFGRFARTAISTTGLPMLSPVPSTPEEKQINAGPGGYPAMLGSRIMGAVGSLPGQLKGAYQYWEPRLTGQVPLKQTAEELSTIKPELAGLATGVAAGDLLGRVPGAVSDARTVLRNKVAPQVEEAGLGVTDVTRGKFGGLRSEEKPQGAIGRNVLEQTTGYSPRAQALSGEQRINDLTKRMEENVHVATRGGVKLSNDAAHQALTEAVNSVPRNAPEIRSKIESLRENLDLPGHEPGTPYSPDEILEIKRGIGKAVKHWGPDWMRDNDLARAEKSVYGALDNELDRGVPGNKEINDNIHGLIPGVSQAVRRAYGAGAIQSMADRWALRTGGSQVGLYELMTGQPIKAAAATALQEAAGRPFLRTAAARALYKLGGGQTLPVPERIPGIVPWEERLGFQGVPRRPLALPPVGGTSLPAGGEAIPLTEGYFPTPEQFRDELISRGLGYPRMLPERAGGPFEMPPSATVEVIPPAERVPGRYSGLLDQPIQSIGPSVIDIQPRPESGPTGIAGRIKAKQKPRNKYL